MSRRSGSLPDVLDLEELCRQERIVLDVSPEQVTPKRCMTLLRPLWDRWFDERFPTLGKTLAASTGPASLAVLAASGHAGKELSVIKEQSTATGEGTTEEEATTVVETGPPDAAQVPQVKQPLNIIDLKTIEKIDAVFLELDSDTKSQIIQVFTYSSNLHILKGAK